MRLKARSAHKIEAVWDRREDRVQALTDRTRFARTVHDKRPASGSRGLARKDRRRDLPQGDRAHEFSESGKEPVADGLRGLRRHIPRRRSRPPRRDDKATALTVRELDERLLDKSPLVGDNPNDGLPRRGEIGREGIADRGARQILVFASAGTIRNGQDSDPRDSIKSAPYLRASAVQENPLKYGRRSAVRAIAASFASSNCVESHVPSTSALRLDSGASIVITVSP